MLDTTPVTTAIAAMIRTGTTEAALLAAVARAFPDLTQQEFVAALQEATELSLNNLAALYQVQGRLAEAAPLYKRAGDGREGAALQPSRHRPEPQ